MLSNEEMRRIEREELDAARALEEHRDRARHAEALHAYRQEVRASLRPARWRVWVLPAVCTALGLVGMLLMRPAAPVDDTSGGISNSALAERCRPEVEARLGRGGLRFPSAREAEGQFNASAEGKRWDGWAEEPGGTRVSFECSFTPADNSVQVELFQDDTT